jgi:hypothetical protein
MAFGDPEILTNEIEIFQWICWIAHIDKNWCVYLLPHLTPGPGAQFIVATLEEAVSLTLFAFARRVSGEKLSTRKEFEHAQRIYNEWTQEQKNK